MLPAKFPNFRHSVLNQGERRLLRQERQLLRQRYPWIATASLHLMRQPVYIARRGLGRRRERSP